jgi:hypothetical protein
MATSEKAKEVTSCTGVPSSAASWECMHTYLPTYMHVWSCPCELLVCSAEGPGSAEGLKEGDTIVTNHPVAAGGSHLPDITVITPVWEDGQVVFFVASRGHHADVGGISPGSIPPHSKTLIEEGAIITSFKLVRDGVFQVLLPASPLSPCVPAVQMFRVSDSGKTTGCLGDKKSHSHRNEMHHVSYHRVSCQSVAKYLHWTTR